ncbi:HAD family hydrolase [Carboxylicivirga marina]|uniref:Beta-phosphoglucomutase family hydrolase n=1 Tax=Carboxylicivirga marina TaxID=2800988 RepID=A0ABS1HPB6_9BACT|nr:beta-phosphoglucomutase family hydrolase [Carboxylicivirga marina]MBK3519533.1 beta-phosphoglucomutase family hydrolase [Carboxylicivirga marina]
MNNNDSSTQNTIVVPEGIKGLIFDMDGTLVNSTPVHYVAWSEACAPYGVQFDYDFFIMLTGRPVLELSKDLIKRYKLDISAKELVRIKEDLVEKNLHNVKLINPVIDVMDRYQGKLPMAVGTGASRERTDFLLKTSGIIDRFDAIVTSDDVNNYKPHPETFLKGAEAIGVKPGECLVFEDGHLGIDAAKTAGMHVIDVKPYYE